MTEQGLKLGQQVVVKDCPQHLNLVGEIIDIYAHQVRIGFPDGTRCWPRRVEPVDSPPESPNP